MEGGELGLLSLLKFIDGSNKRSNLQVIRCRDSCLIQFPLVDDVPNKIERVYNGNKNSLENKASATREKLSNSGCCTS